MEHHISVVNVTKKMGETEVLSHINIELEGGQVYGMIGINGSGKSMLIRVLSGLVIPTEGYVEYDGKRLFQDMEVPQGLGVMIENEEMYPEFTGLKNLKFLGQINNKVTENDIKNAMLRVGLDPMDKRTYKKYSLGMRQKLSIAQAIMEDQQFLLLDEPTNGLDEESVQLFHRIILEEKTKGCIILLASHSKEDIYKLCDKVYVMKNGVLKLEEAEQ